jgi:pimeloyl-ACP methyl ester carboxylesterase
MLKSKTMTIGLEGLGADLEVPTGAAGLIVFAHGVGSSRRSARDRQVAEALHGRGLATLQVDLLTPAEAQDPRLACDIDVLAARLSQAMTRVADEPAVAQLPMGLFGASTGAAAALVAAATVPTRVAAVVSRGGRPDLAGERLARVRAPTLLIVGAAGRDVPALNPVNRDALRALTCARRLEVIPGASDRFEEPGALEAVTELAADWFDAHLWRAA